MKLLYVRGLPVLPDRESQRMKCNSMEYKPNDGDIIEVSFPKTGTTWLQYIILQILHRGSYCHTSMTEILHRGMPVLDLVDIQVISDLPPPKAYRTHFPFHMLNLNKNAKYIYIHRNPKDTLVSFYHFQKQIPNISEPDFDQFFQDFIKGEVWYGNFFDHVLSFYEHREDDNVLFLSYEKMLENQRGAVLQIARFLGESYHEDIISDEELLQRILKHTSFDYMKKNLKFDYPFENKPEEPFTFFRRGVIGDGKTYLSEEQSRILLKETLEKVGGTELEELWTTYY